MWNLEKKVENGIWRISLCLNMNTNWSCFLFMWVIWSENCKTNFLEFFEFQKIITLCPNSFSGITFKNIHAMTSRFYLFTMWDSWLKMLFCSYELQSALSSDFLAINRAIRTRVLQIHGTLDKLNPKWNSNTILYFYNS